MLHTELFTFGISLTLARSVRACYDWQGLPSCASKVSTGRNETVMIGRLKNEDRPTLRRTPPGDIGSATP